MENSIPLDAMPMPEHFFAKIFSAMFVGMAPLISTSAIIAEEKEQNTLRALLMSNVTPPQYLLGIGSYVWLLCMLGAIVFGVCNDYSAAEFLQFLLIMAAGIFLSVLLGAIIGIISKNQMSATSLTVPVMIVFSFLPMLAMFNETIEKLATFVYSQQVFLLINRIGTADPEPKNILILFLNATLAIIIFFSIYKKKGME